jgi:Tfp pilus assembly protein FimT
MKSRVTIFSLAVILVMGIFASITMARMSRTYEGQNAAVSVYELQQDPDSYDDSKADGAAAAIVQQNLAKSHAVNDVTSIVFDFRGYDTMGEAFILITAVAGSAVILFTKKEKKEDSSDEK